MLREPSCAGSITNFLAAPLSKSLYPVGASSRVMVCDVDRLRDLDFVVEDGLH